MSLKIIKPRSHEKDNCEESNILLIILSNEHLKPLSLLRVQSQV